MRLFGFRLTQYDIHPFEQSVTTFASRTPLPPFISLCSWRLNFSSANRMSANRTEPRLFSGLSFCGRRGRLRSTRTSTLRNASDHRERLWHVSRGSADWERRLAAGKPPQSPDASVRLKIPCGAENARELTFPARHRLTFMPLSICPIRRRAVSPWLDRQRFRSRTARRWSGSCTAADCIPASSSIYESVHCWEVRWFR